MLKQSKQFCSIVFIFGVLICGADAGNSAVGQDSESCDAQMILFTPSDVGPPPAEEVQQRLQEFGEYAELFFNDGLKQWGHEPARKEIFKRDSAGKISVINIKSDFPSKNDAYKKQWISRQVQAKLRNDHKIKPWGQLYWIFVYVGDPPKKSGAFKGGGNPKTGGWGVANYTNIKGKVALNQDLVSARMDKFLFKGCLHEFGHGMGLPHIGPKVELKLGNTLMGPITKIYTKQKLPRKTKAYLAEGSAAILSVHPVFTGQPPPKGDVPPTVFQDVTVKADAKSNTIDVKGKLDPAATAAHRVLVLDDRDDKLGEYWVKSFVSEIDGENNFSISIPQAGRKGKLKIVAIYENGDVTGDGKSRGLESAMVVPYSFR